MIGLKILKDHLADAKEQIKRGEIDLSNRKEGVICAFDKIEELRKHIQELENDIKGLEYYNAK